MRNAPGQDASESTRERGSGEEECDAKLALLPYIPHTQIKHDPGKQAGLNRPENKPRGVKPGPVLHNAQQRRHDTPHTRQRREPKARRGALQNDVTRNFEEDVAGEEEGQAGEVLVAGHVGVLVEALDFGVGDVAAVEEGHEVEDCDGGEEGEVEFADEGAFVDCAWLFHIIGYLLSLGVLARRRGGGFLVHLGLDTKEGWLVSGC